MRARPRRSVPSASGSPARTAGPISAARPRARRSRTRKRRPYWRGSARTRCGTCRATGTPSRATRGGQTHTAGGPADGPKGDCRRRERLPGRTPVPAAAQPLAARRRTVTGRGPPALGRHRGHDDRRRPGRPDHHDAAAATGTGPEPAYPAASCRPRRRRTSSTGGTDWLQGLRNAGGADRARRPEALLVPGLPAGLSRYACPCTPALPSPGRRGLEGNEKSPSGEGLFSSYF